jgi:5'-3' exonuclease
MKGISELDEVVNAPELENLMIVDGLNFAFRYKHRGQTDFAAEYLRTLHSLAKSYGAKEVIILNDWKHSSFRREVDPGYKMNRKDKYDNQSEEEKQKALDFFEGFEKAMELIKTQFT